LITFDARRHLAICRASSEQEAKQKAIAALQIEATPLEAIGTAAAWGEAVNWAGWTNLELWEELP